MSERSVLRHTLTDRVMHWLFAGSILALLITGLLPQFGITFDWINYHWMTGILLLLLTVFHVIRSVVFKSPRSVIPERRDFTSALPGKFSLAQKLMHDAVALIVLVSVATGLLMTVKIDTPFWERNPYWLSAGNWGVIYVLHGLMSLCFVSVIMLHVYFSLRPEKRLYLRSILRGTITRAQYAQHHDAGRWQPDETGKQ